MSYRTDLQNTIDLISENFFFDPEPFKIGGREVPHWNTALLVLSYALDQTALLVGEPGFSKTTAAKVVSSIMSGYPFDLYEAAQIQGHPDQTYETMLARLDFSKLSQEEAVIWLTSAYLPVRIIDELPRLPGGKQDELLNTLETGRFNYLNATFYTGRTPFFATANHPDDGSNPLIPPLRDRFAVSVEIGYIGATYNDNIRAAMSNIETLKDTRSTSKIIDIVNDKNHSVEKRLALIEQARQEYAARMREELKNRIFDPESKAELQREITKVPFTTEANVFSQMITAELNSTPQYGRKRSSDKVDTSNHAQKLASSKVRNALSPRATIRGLEQYAQAVAYLNGEREVTKFHINALAPQVLGHRLEFTEDFRAQYQDHDRLDKNTDSGEQGMGLEMFLAAKLVEGIEANYQKVKTNLDLLVTAVKDSQGLSQEHKNRIEGMKQEPDIIDHPLVKEYFRRLRGKI